MSRSTSWGILHLCSCLAVCAVVPQLSAQPITWQDDYGRSRALAATSGRPLLVVVVRSGCDRCRQLLEGTLADPAVAATVDRRFIAVRLDAQRYPDYVKQLNVRSLPITILASAAGDIVNAVEGPSDAAAMASALQQTLAKVQKPVPAVTVARPVSRASAPTAAMPEPMSVAARSAPLYSQPAAYGSNAMYGSQQPGYQGMPAWMYTSAPAFAQPKRSC